MLCEVVRRHPPKHRTLTPDEHDHGGMWKLRHGFGLGACARWRAPSSWAVRWCSLRRACPISPRSRMDPDASGMTEQASTCGDGVIDLLEDGGDGGESCDPGEAGAAGCEFCRFTCSGGIDDAGHCYFFADPTKTYNDAIIACRGAAGHVVTLASVREAAFVSALAQDASAHWVGLIFDNALNGYASPSGSGEPGWPNEGQSCRGCYVLGADDAGGFPLGTGADASANNACLVSEDGGSTRVECSGEQLRTTLCEREPIGQRIYPCGGLLCTTVLPTETTKRYVVWPSAMGADQARSLCEGSYDGGSLVILDTPEEREQLARELRQRLPLPAEVWIGLSQVDGGWVWTMGRTDRYRGAKASREREWVGLFFALTTIGWTRSSPVRPKARHRQ